MDNPIKTNKTDQPTIAAKSMSQAAPPAVPHPVETDVEDPSAVMIPSLQEPNMLQTYVGLPLIEYVYAIYWLVFFYLMHTYRCRSFADITPFGFDSQGGLRSMRASITIAATNMVAADFE